MAKFLDQAGLVALWGKIKNLVKNGELSINTKVGNTITEVSDFTANQADSDSITFEQGTNIILTPNINDKKITISHDTPTGASEQSTTAVLKKLKWDAQGHIIGTENISDSDVGINNGTFSVKTKIGQNNPITAADFTANQAGTDDVTFVQGENIILTTDTTDRTITISADINETANLTDLIDVSVSNPTQGQVILYDATNSLWKNSTLSAPTWGNIEGTLTNQTDLKNALDGKQPTGNYVTTDTTQTITAQKTFNARVNFLGTGDANAIYLTTDTRIDVNGTSYTVLGFASGTFLINHANYNLRLRGRGTRPTYNTDTNPLALLSDIPTNVSSLTNDAGYLTEHQDISGKADKVSGATNGNFAGLDSNGNLIDSGKSASDFGTYSKPNGGIPASDLANDVQTNLTLASTALQSFTETDPTVPSHVKSISQADITNWNSKTSNIGTITGITMNGISKGTSGVVDLGTVIVEHQDISGKADKVENATFGNLASLDSEGNIADSSIAASTVNDAITKRHTHSNKTMLDLVPSSLGTVGQALMVNAAGTGLEFGTVASSATQVIFREW